MRKGGGAGKGNLSRTASGVRKCNEWMIAVVGAEVVVESVGIGRSGDSARE
jgi:hypothetical protein